MGCRAARRGALLALASWPAALIQGGGPAGDSTATRFGNLFCFGSGFSYDACCGNRHSACWAGPFTYEACCYTAPVRWVATGPKAEARLDVLTGESAARPHPQTPCTDGKGAEELADYSGWPLADGAADPAGCAKAGGAVYDASVEWSGPGRRRYANFSVCAPRTCLPEEVAADLVPLRFAAHFSAQGRTALLQYVTAKVRPPGADAWGAFQRVGTLGPRTAPGNDGDLAAYVRALMVCGHCELERYGSAADGGYLMCGVGAGVEAVYSYGIDGADAWGTAVSEATGARVHQYDCFNTARPDCTAPSVCTFHEECLTGHNYMPKLSGTLAQHLEANGHARVRNGSLLLKVDIEGSEWDVFSTADVADLRRFQQVALELHHARPFNKLADERQAVQLAAMRNLLSVFIVAHVHINPACPPPGSCLEVTLASRDLVTPFPECRAPARHPLDDARPSADLAAFFQR